MIFSLGNVVKHDHPSILLNFVLDIAVADNYKSLIKRGLGISEFKRSLCGFEFKATDFIVLEIRQIVLAVWLTLAEIKNNSFAFNFHRSSFCDCFRLTRAGRSFK